MKIMLAVLVLLPSFAQALSYPAPMQPCVVDGCTPDRPGKPLPWPKPNPKPWDDASLDNLFTGSAMKQKGSETTAVSAGDWRSEPRGGVELAQSSWSPKGEKAMPSVDGAKIVRVSGTETLVGIAVPIIIDQASKAVEKYVDRDQTKESIEKYGGCRTKGTCDK